MIRRDLLPDQIGAYGPALLRQLCEENGWNVRDLADEVADPPGSIRARLDHFGIEPDPRKSPHENLAEDLWKASPEDYGLTELPPDRVQVTDNRESVDPDLSDWSDTEGGAA